MKKRFLVAAMAATLVSPLAAFADATVYGNVHLSIDSADDDNPATNTIAEELQMNTNTSAIGVKGKEDLGGGMSAIFKVEFQIDPSERCNNDVSGNCNAITDRDQWVGLKGAMGTVKFGTMSSNYKQMGGKVDPMYRTQLEGRAAGGQTNLHSGAGLTRGRSENTLQYTSPKMSGVSVVFNTTFSGNDDETMGLGVRYKTKNVLAYFDYIDMDTDGLGAGIVTESAMKIGGSFKTGAITLGLQHELTEDLLGEDVTFFSANYQMNDNDNIAFSFATAAARSVTVGDDGSGFALMYNHKMSKRTNVYAGYGVEDINDDTLDNSVFTLGLRKKF